MVRQRSRQVWLDIYDKLIAFFIRIPNDIRPKPYTKIASQEHIREYKYIVISFRVEAPDLRVALHFYHFDEISLLLFDLCVYFVFCRILTVKTLRKHLAVSSHYIHIALEAHTKKNRKNWHAGILFTNHMKMLNSNWYKYKSNMYCQTIWTQFSPKYIWYESILDILRCPVHKTWAYRFNHLKYVDDR